mmetsp:Transcript_36879/g.85053  ORF Transcript_36879/g.85053 Transcript_36879/m.85053 type:complete len:369 (-) Transcript_36879:191-1297(-)
MVDKLASATVPGFAMVAAAFERLQAVVDEQNVALKELRHDHDKLRWEHEGFRKELAVLKAGVHGAIGTGCTDAVAGMQAMSRAKSLSAGLTISTKSHAASDSVASLPTRTWATMLGLESPRTPGAERTGRGHNSWMTACSTAEATPDSHRRDSAAELRELMSRSSSSSMGGAGEMLSKEYDQPDSRIPSSGRRSGSKPFTMPAVMAPAPTLPADLEVRQFLTAGDQGAKARPTQDVATGAQSVEGLGAFSTPRLSSICRTPRVLDIHRGTAAAVVPQATPRTSMARTLSETATAWYALTALGQGGDVKSPLPAATPSRSVPDSTAAMEKQDGSVPRSGATNGMWELDWSAVAPGSGRSSASSAKQAAS